MFLPTRRAVFLAILSDLLDEVLVYLACVLAAIFLLSSCASPTFDVAEALTTDYSQDPEADTGGGDRPDSGAGDTPGDGEPLDIHDSSGAIDGREDSAPPAKDSPPPDGGADSAAPETPEDAGPLPDAVAESPASDAADSAPSCPSGVYCVAGGKVMLGGHCDALSPCCSGSCSAGTCVPPSGACPGCWCGGAGGFPEWCPTVLGGECVP